MIVMLPICPFCKHGLMIKPEIPKTTDYNEQGIVEAFCSNCGKGYIYFKTGWEQILKISKRNLGNLIIKIIMKNKLPFNIRKDIENKIYKNMTTRTEIVEFLSKTFEEDPGFIEQNLTGQIFLI